MLAVECGRLLLTTKGVMVDVGGVCVRQVLRDSDAVKQEKSAAQAGLGPSSGEVVAVDAASVSSFTSDWALQPNKCTLARASRASAAHGA